MCLGTNTTAAMAGAAFTLQGKSSTLTYGSLSLFCAGAVDITCMLYVMNVDTHGLYMSHYSVIAHWFSNSQTSRR
jgi:hypothetical protein